MTTQASPGYHSGPNVSAFTTIGKGIDSNIMDSTSGSTSSGSHVIANINKKAPSNPRHIRQNFGKDRGYIPPDAMNAHLRLSATETPVKSKVHTAERPVQVTPEERSSDNDNEMPFDVLNSMIIRDRSTGISQAHQRTPPEPASPPLTNSQMVEDDGYFSPISTRECESVWESSPEREESKHRQDLSQKIDQLASPGGRFELRPPKFSDPLPLYVNDDMERSIKGMNDMVDQLGAIAEEARSYSFSPQNVPEPCDYEELGFSSNAIGTNEHPELPLEGSNPEDEDSVFDFQEEQRRVSPQFPGSQERPVNITHKIRRRTRKTKQLDAENEDDTSLEFSYGPAKSGSPTNLSERAQQAWRSRREKHSSSLRSKQDPRRTKPEKVSFGASDTVHTFEPDIPESDEDDDTIPSFEDRSLNSEYTKTLESEVEDMIKDILFIGNGTASKPGRRKLKHKHEVKRKLRQLQKENQGETSLEQVDEDVAGEETSSLDRVGEESTKASTSHDAFQTPRTSQGSRSKSKGKNKQPKKASKQNDEDDPLGFVWDFVSGGVGAVTNVLGIATDEAPPSDNTAGEQATVNRKSSSRKRGSVENKEDEFGCTDFLEVITGETCGGKVTPTQEPKEGMQKMMDDAQDYWYGPIGESGSYSFGVSGSMSKDSGSQMTEDNQLGQVDSEDVPISFSSKDKNQRLAQLALRAARSLHQLKGVRFDESSAIDMYSDIQISVVELKLPLGLIFVENDGGCFVNKVSPDGSAARSGGVQAGDQLASVNGISNMKWKVDDICSVVEKAPKGKSLELVFLRYIGPLRPSKEEPSKAEKSNSKSQTMTKGFEAPKDTKKKGFLWFGRKKKGSSKGN